MQKGKIIPTNNVVDKIYDNMKKQEYNDRNKVLDKEMYQAPKKKLRGKLKDYEVDIIRYLNTLDFKVFVIAEYFGVRRNVITSIKKREYYHKHLSPFEVKFGKYGATIDEDALEIWLENYKEPIDLFCKFYEERVSRDVFIAKR